MLIGDKEEVGRVVAEKLGLNESFGGLPPGDKTHKVEEFLTAKPKEKTLGSAGDGINNAPVLARVDVGVVTGGIDSDTTVEAADAVIMADKPSGVVDGTQIVGKTMGIVKQNIIFAIGVETLILILATVGQAPM